MEGVGREHGGRTEGVGREHAGRTEDVGREHGGRTDDVGRSEQEHCSGDSTLSFPLFNRSTSSRIAGRDVELRPDDFVA